MSMNRIAASVLFWLLAGLLGTGCAGLSKELASLDASELKSNEGVFVVRFLTSRADADDLAHPESDPDLSYSVMVGPHKSVLMRAAGYKGSLDVEAEHGPVLIARGLEAGDYYFNGIGNSQGSSTIAVRFSVLPGRVTYIGDLHVMFIESKGFFQSNKLKLEVRTDDAAMMSQLRARFPSVPTVETVPMVIESGSL